MNKLYQIVESASMIIAITLFCGGIAFFILQ